jgi:hypothetical protein
MENDFCVLGYHIVRQMFTDVLEEQTASIFKVKESLEYEKKWYGYSQ